ncbi:MAG TPA: fibronectin type III domain-containing protein [Terriglobales bacterium]|nr:fibronectin type III domain-containing protein [Terriglobales bacterium]
MTRPGAGLVAAMVGLSLLAACGRKDDPRPPEDVAPVAVAELTATNIVEGVRLSWERPRHYAGGGKLTDLGYFEVWRLDPGQPRQAQRIATIRVDDRQRFQQAKRFSHVDNDTVPGNLYQYYVVVFTADGYDSTPSNIATITRTEVSRH